VLDTTTSSGPPVIDVRKVRLILKARRVREQQFGRGLFSDPAWDLLLEAFAADLEGQRLSTEDLCRLSTVSAAVTLRWIKKLEFDDWLRRTGSPDGTEYLAMTPQGSAKLRRYFEVVGSVLIFV
jgi:hypothetical protein